MSKSRGEPRKYEKKPYESNCQKNDTSANIYMSMLMSPAWKDLTPKQQQLYVYCKAQKYAEKSKTHGEESYTMNRSKWCSLYELYAINNAKGFYRDMEALITHGFVDCVECGANTRTKSIYKLSSRWHNYDKPGYEVPLGVMTSAMRRKVFKP